ncbi:uncharacterized protein [Amphiura filiformis]|uniref:uncharacterized protein n=1 Tax=Amphiura filiformis TaxID=82378 RepID=UPI003B21E18E
MLATLRNVLECSKDESTTWKFVCDSCMTRANRISKMCKGDAVEAAIKEQFIAQFKETTRKYSCRKTPSSSPSLQQRYKRMSTESPQSRGPSKRVLPFSLQPTAAELQPTTDDIDAAIATALEDVEDLSASAEVKVEIVVHYPSRIRRRTLHGPWVGVGKALSLGNEDAALQQVLHMPNGKQEASLLVVKVVEEEGKRICKKPSKDDGQVSAFRDNTPAALNRFNYSNQKSEMERNCPVLLTILEAAAMNKTQLKKNKAKTEESLVPGIMTAASILFNCRSQEMNAHQTLTGLQLKRAGADKKCFERMNVKKLSVVHSVVKKIQFEYGRNHDQAVHEWKKQMKEDKQREMCITSWLQDLEEQTASAVGNFQRQIASKALSVRAPALKQQLDDHNSTRHPGFRLVGDNVDLKVKPRYMSTDKQNVDHHHFQHIAVKNRISGMHLPDDEPIGTPESTPLTELQPNASDNKALHYEWSILIGQIISSHCPHLSWMKNCLPSLTHKHMDSMKKKSEVVNLGVIMQNENTKEGIAVIVKDQNGYIPEDGQGNPITTPLGGDQLTIERSDHAIEDQRDAFSPMERLEGLQPVIEDFHTQGNFYQAIWKELYHQYSAGDIGTLMSARNILQAKNVTKDPMKNLNAAKAFLDKYTEALVLAAAMDFFGMQSPADEPTKNVITPLEQCQEKAMEVLGKIVNKYAIPSDEEFEASQTTPLKCPFCGNPFNLVRTLQMHVKKRHSRVNIQAVLAGTSQAEEETSTDSVFNYSCNALSMCLLAFNFDDARKMGDGERIIRLLKFIMLHFKVTGKFKYANHTFRHIAQVKCLLSPRLAYEVTWNRSVNMQGRKDSNVEHDRKVEHDNRTYKQNVRGFHGKLTEKSVQRVSRSAQKVEAVLTDVDRQTDVKSRSGKHAAPDQTADIITLAGRFQTEQIFNMKPGRHHHFFPDFPRSLLSRIDIDDFHDWMKKELGNLSNKNIFKCIKK